MNKKGFTLVELMVVIVIIGVLAAVAIPKMMAATNKAKASEGPQILGTIANMQHAFKAEMDTFITCDVTKNSTTKKGIEPTEGDGWKEIGMDVVPFSKYYEFKVETKDESANFDGTADLYVGLGTVTKSGGNKLTIDNLDERIVSGNDFTDFQKLVPNWR
jgi:type IV pilus assembly protein PilA